MKREIRSAEELLDLALSPCVAKSGSKVKGLQDMDRYMSNPTMPMVKDGIANNKLASTDNMNIAPSKLYEDGGHKMRCLQVLAHRGATAKVPNTSEGMIAAAEDYLAFCGTNAIPPTISAFAVYNGISLARLNQIERGEDISLSQSIAFVKDIIRTFLELSAMDSTLNPIIYFHQNKVYYGAVENQQVNVHIDVNNSELTPEEYHNRTSLLLDISDTDIIDCD